MSPLPHIARSKDAASIWLLRDHLTPLIGPQHTDGHFAMAVSCSLPGEGPPPHVHSREDEAFYILEGEMTFLCGDQQLRARPGTFVWGPRDLVHCFRCTSNTPAKMVLMVSPTTFLDFAMTLAEPSVGLDSPPTLDEAKIAQLMRVAPQHGIQMKPDHPMPSLVRDQAHPSRRLWVLGEDVSFLATRDETGGAFTFADIRTAPGGGPPPHVHTQEDEIFYIIQGTHDVLLDGRVEHLEPGDAAYIPRGTRHRYTCTSRTPGRLLSIHTPGGFESFFNEVGVPYDQHPEPPPPPPMTPEDIVALLARHRMTP